MVITKTTIMSLFRIYLEVLNGDENDFGLGGIIQPLPSVSKTSTTIKANTHHFTNQQNLKMKIESRSIEVVYLIKI